MYKDNNGVVMGIAYCSDGYLLPCCWLDTEWSKKTLVELGLYDNELKLENNNSVEDIVKSNQWKSFIRILQEEPELAPKKCHEKCKND
jgi:hypothetical protein